MSIPLNYIAFIFLVLGSIFWIGIYVEMIKIAFSKKIVVYPLLCNALNLSWEFIYTFVKPASFLPSLISNFFWFLLNFIVLISFFRYSKRSGFINLLIFGVVFFIIYFFINKVDSIVSINGIGTINILILLGFLFSLTFVLGMLYMLKIKKTTKNHTRRIALYSLLGCLGYSLEIFLNPVHAHLLNWALLVVIILPLLLMIYYYLEVCKISKV